MPLFDREIEVERSTPGGPSEALENMTAYPFISNTLLTKDYHSVYYFN